MTLLVLEVTERVDGGLVGVLFGLEEGIKDDFFVSLILEHRGLGRFLVVVLPPTSPVLLTNLFIKIFG